jgi:hypothetical protein
MHSLQVPEIPEGVAVLIRCHSPVFLKPDYAQPNRLALTFWILETSLLRLLFRLEWFRQWRELAANVSEEHHGSVVFGISTL